MKDKLEDQSAQLLDEILSIQASLGQKRMFDADGQELSIAEFTIERQKLKAACGWRLAKRAKVRAQLKELNKAAKPTPRMAVVGMAFNLICRDVAEEKSTDSGSVANFYMDLALDRLTEGGDPQTCPP